MLRISITLIAFILSLANLCCQIQESYKSIPFDSEAFGESGYDCDAHGEWIVVGGKDNFETGRCFIYRFNGNEWVEHQSLSPDDSAGEFGISVAIHGDFIAIGAPSGNYGNGPEGSVYLYRNTNDIWSFEEQLFLPNELELAPCEFGYRVDLNNENMAVSGRTCNESKGEVFIYSLLNGSWLFQESFNSNDEQTTFLGNELSLNPTSIFVSTQDTDEVELNGGAVYYFENQENSWVEIQKIIPSMPDPFSRYGFGLSSIDDYLFIGQSHLDFDGIQRVGRVYVYKKIDDLYEEIQIIDPIEMIDQALFGWKIDSDESRIIVSAPSATLNGGDGTSNVFSFTQSLLGNWELENSYFVSDPDDSELAGWSLALTNIYGFVAGDPGNDEGGGDRGAVYFYDDVFTSVEEVNSEASLKIFPNPTESALNISSDQLFSKAEVLDNMGRSMLELSFAPTNTQQLDLSQLAHGLYTIKVRVGDVFVLKRVVVG